jgi:uncharacterized membrane protein
MGLWQEGEELAASDLCTELETEIRAERRRRKCVLLARAVARISLDSFAEKLGSDREEVAALLARLAAEGAIAFSIESGIVAFAMPSLSQEIRMEAQRFARIPTPEPRTVSAMRSTFP